MSGPQILVVRLGAMGDVIHTLPAVASLKHSIPYSRITWVIEPKWIALLEGNPYVDQVIALDRATLGGIRESVRKLRARKFDIAVDFQGLTKSALVATLAWPDRIYGYADPRERAASWFYSSRVSAKGQHMVDRNLDLAAAAGAASLVRSFPLPQGRPEGGLPSGEFVLASPLAGWGSKQWPLDFYSELGRRIRLETGMTLVLNGPHRMEVNDTVAHASGLPGLIDATRRAAAVVGVDSGPLHLAAALGKPGIAIFGPTDPARNGPYQGAIHVLRAPGSHNGPGNRWPGYRRDPDPHASMRSITPDMAFAALKQVLAGTLAK